MQRSSQHETPTISTSPPRMDGKAPVSPPLPSATRQESVSEAPPRTLAPDGSAAHGSAAHGSVPPEALPAGAVVLRLPGITLARSRLRRALSRLRKMDQVSQQEAAELLDAAFTDIHTAIDALA